MNHYTELPPSVGHLYQITLQLQTGKSNVYSMGTSAEDAYNRYIARTLKRKESIEGLVFVQGELAEPPTRMR